jgi:uncharacterized Fe-S center protein
MYIQRQVVKFLEYEEQKEIVDKINRLFQERNMRAFFKRNKLFKVKIELLSDQYENFFLRVSFHINQNENRLRRTTTDMLVEMVKVTYNNKINKAYKKVIKQTAKDEKARGNIKSTLYGKTVM